MIKEQPLYQVRCTLERIFTTTPDKTAIRETSPEDTLFQVLSGIFQITRDIDGDTFQPMMCYHFLDEVRAEACNIDPGGYIHKYAKQTLWVRETNGAVVTDFPVGPAYTRTERFDPTNVVPIRKDDLAFVQFVRAVDMTTRHPKVGAKIRFIDRDTLQPFSTRAVDLEQLETLRVVPGPKFQVEPL